MAEPRCTTDEEFEALIRMAGQACFDLGHTHRIHHCAEGLVLAECRWEAMKIDIPSPLSPRTQKGEGE